MIKKIIFVIVFVPVHWFLTMMLVQWYWFNYNPNMDTGLWAQFAHVMSFVFSVPILLPFILTDMGEYWPLPLQLLPSVCNSLLWAVVVLLIFSGIKRLRGRKAKPQAPQFAQPTAAQMQ
ncbi:MAG: hypothetical protein ACYS6W_07995 [Planctomycetota bacterium]|jgi:hypothetical protein